MYEKEKAGSGEFNASLLPAFHQLRRMAALEVNLRADTNLARFINHGVAYTTKGRAGVNGGRESEINVIEDVEELKP